MEVWDGYVLRASVSFLGEPDTVFDSTRVLKD